MVARLIPVTNGKIFFKGQDVLKTEPSQASPKYRSQVQIFFQDPFSSLNPVHTVEHHLARLLVIHKKAGSRQQIYERVCELLDTVELKPASTISARNPHQLSGDQRQRVAIARALTEDLELILADESISKLDVSIRMGVLTLMQQFKECVGFPLSTAPTTWPRLGISWTRSWSCMPAIWLKAVPAKR